MNEKKFKIENLKVNRGEKEVVHGVSLELLAGKIQVLMGPNGSGKSSLANALAGHPDYQISYGQILLNGEDITEFSVDKRARAGLLLSLQSSPEVPGVPFGEFLRLAYNTIQDQDIDPIDFRKMLEREMKQIGLSIDFADRGINQGFSGGERKKSEILQLMILGPKYAILDEIDSGVDVDALRVVAKGIEKLVSDGVGVLLITHHTRILDYLQPDQVLVMKSGNIVQVGGLELAKEIEEQGFEAI